MRLINSATTGVWSDGRSPLQGSMSIHDLETAGFEDHAARCSIETANPGKALSSFLIPIFHFQICESEPRQCVGHVVKSL